MFSNIDQKAHGDHVSDRHPMPSQWLDLFEKVKLKASYRALGTRAGVEYTAARRVLLGLGTSYDTVASVARAFEVHPDEIYRRRGEEPVRPFTLPDTAGRLSQPERDAVLAVVNAILNAKDEQHGLSNSASPLPRTPGQANQGKEGLPSGHDPQWPSGTDWPTGDDETGMGGGKDAEDG